MVHKKKCFYSLASPFGCGGLAMQICLENFHVRFGDNYNSTYSKMHFFKIYLLKAIAYF